MSTLAEQMADIAAANNLTSFSIGYYSGEGFPAYFHCYAHGGTGFVGSAGEPGDAPADAISKAIAELNSKRHHQPAVLDLVAA